MRPSLDPPARYVLLSFDYPPNGGGIARLCSEIVQGLQHSSRVAVITQHNNVNGTVVPTGPNIFEIRVRANFKVRALEAWWHLVWLRQPATVIAGRWFPEGLIALLAGRHDVAILGHGAEFGPPYLSWRKPFWGALRRWTLERASVVVTSSSYTAQLVKSVASAANVTTLPLGVDHKRFAPGDVVAARNRLRINDPTTLVVCTVARIHDYKGIDVVLDAIAALPSLQRDRFVYVVCGTGPALPGLQAHARSLGIDHHVRWLGFVDDASLHHVYQAANLFALCTRESLENHQVEGFGLVFLEAQACGIPVVGTRTGGIAQAVIEDQGGWLIDQDDVTGLSAILADLAEFPAHFRAAGKVARDRVEREATWSRYIQHLKGLLNKSPDI